MCAVGDPGATQRSQSNRYKRSLLNSEVFLWHRNDFAKKRKNGNVPIGRKSSSLYRLTVLFSLAVIDETRQSFDMVVQTAQVVAAVFNFWFHHISKEIKTNICNSSGAFQNSINHTDDIVPSTV